MIDIHFVKPFGAPSPRHERLLNLWLTLGERFDWRIHAHRHGNRRHIDNIRLMAESIEADKHRTEWVIIGEHDFIPNRGYPFGTEDPEKFDGFAVPFHHRDRNDYTRLLHYGHRAPWFMCWNTKRGFRFSAREHLESSRDPGWYLEGDREPRIHEFRSHDPYPDHYGMEYGNVGCHLFWSHFYGSDPNQISSGFYMKDVLAKVDKRIAQAYAMWEVPELERSKWRPLVEEICRDSA